MGELDGKVAIVTGAGRLKGIGRAAAVHLARMGADVVVTSTGRSPDKYPDEEKAAGWKDIESTAEQVRAEGRKALPLVVDVTSRGQVGWTCWSTTPLSPGGRTACPSWTWTPISSSACLT